MKLLNFGKNSDLMKSIFYIVWFFIAFNTLSYSQNNREFLPNSSQNLPVEDIFTHINSGLLFVGDHFYYKIYCLDAQSLKPTSLSNIAYLKLFSSDKKVVYSKVINLKNGLGYGDYLLPLNLKTGNYKVVVYTNWMLNNQNHAFFEQNLLVINPYSNQKLGNTNNEKSQEIFSDDYKISDLGITMNKSIFSSREKVKISLDDLAEGNYSVSVRILDSIPHPLLKTSEQFASNSDNTIFAKFDALDDLRIPEIGGKLLKGKIESLQANKLVKDIPVSLSIPGDDFYLNIASTDANGNFYFVIDQPLTDRTAIIDVLKDRNSFNLNIEELNHLPEERIKGFSNFSVLPEFKNEILKRSIYNQIENSYYTLKPDTIFQENEIDFFKGVDKAEFVLDDYTRFKTVQETFTEIVQFARIRRDNDEKFNFQVLGYPPYNDFNFGSLTIIDGVIVKDSNHFIRNFDANKIESIQVIRNKYYLSTLIFNGIVIIQTKNKNYWESLALESQTTIEVSSSNQKKSYFKQTYSEQSRLPDYRMQLLWDPNLKLDLDNSFDFYTSDVKGEFEISIQGFTKEGEAISLYKTFMVE